MYVRAYVHMTSPEMTPLYSLPDPAQHDVTSGPIFCVRTQYHVTSAAIWGGGNTTSVIYQHAKLMMTMKTGQFSLAVGTPFTMFAWKVQHVHYVKKQLTRK